ncbi:cytochrome P450 [Williamsia phyllosphaerae]|uniref:Cytochrome P450 n=1 Tax=Williamsia phyllosphaerae TaxID=885042 RepID=A0ABQ1UYH7_9NOCA|nr:cytochrome P450 [Williamsia phyllosphaerae]GGF30311.1 cytochrome P450 [Williamsia phyllosphaerae]
MTAEPVGFVFDPFADGFTDDPHPHYARLRDRAPVCRHPLGFWIVSRHADVAHLQRSAQSVDEQSLADVPEYKRDSAEMGKANRMMAGLSMIDRDPPDHTRLRRLVAAAFIRRSVHALEPRIVDLVDEACDRLADAGRVDVVADLAFPLPFIVISELLGLPMIDGARLRELTGTLVRGLEPLPDPSLAAEIRTANAELTSMVSDMIAHRRTRPADDLITALLRGDDHGDVLTPDELVAQVMLLYIAGHETTVNLIAGGLSTLIRHPAQLALLRTTPGLADNAVDEMLRYDSPVHLMRRITTTPMMFPDGVIPAGVFVTAAIAAANRDPRVFGPDADVPRIDRADARRHLSFGAGIHHCIGAALARLEARVVFTRFAARFPDAVVDETRWNGRINVRGPASLLVTVR